MTRKLTLCADDFAYSRGTSLVIAVLARLRRINAVSCMAVMPNWPADAELLRGIPSDCEVGLHITLTDEKPLGPMPQLAPGGHLPSADALLRRSAMPCFPTTEVKAEVCRQFGAFARAFGRAPDFVDAHQHVHHHPRLRAIVLDVTRDRAPDAWVRACSDSIPAMLRRPFSLKSLGSAWHSLGFRRAAAKRGLATNDSFAGHYDFSPSRFGQIFERFLEAPGRHHVVMTHPGAADRGDDPIGRARQREAEYLSRMAFLPEASDERRQQGPAWPGSPIAWPAGAAIE